MSLGLRLALLVLLAAVPIFLLQIFYELEARTERQERVIENVQSLADQIAARQNRFVEAASFLLTAISRLESIRTGDPAQCGRELKQIRTPFPEITGIGLIKPDGWSHCTSTDRTQPINISDRPYFQKALRTRTTQTSGHIVGRASGVGSFVFARPVLNDDGAVHSVIVLAFGSEVLSKDLNDPPLPQGAFAALVDHEGTVVARWPSPKEWVGRKLSGSEWKQAVENRRRVVGIATDEAQGQIAVASAPMQPPADLSVIAGRPIAPELRRLDVQFWREIALVAGVFILAAIGAGIFGFYGVQRPVHALVNSADALSRGEFERANQPDTQGGIPELRLLADQFRRMAEALSIRQRELEEAVQHKEMLLKEVNHRVKNSLQLVASLLALQRSRINDPGIRRDFEEATRRVSMVARVHQKLYQDEHVDSVQFDQFLREMCEELSNAIGSDQGLQLQCRAAECRLSTDKAIPLALIVNELVFNAIKHAYPKNSSGMVRIDCRTNDGELVLTVTDDGDPLPADFNPAHRDGLGMRVVGALTKQIGGNLEVRPEQVGKSFVVRAPI